MNALAPLGLGPADHLALGNLAGGLDPNISRRKVIEDVFADIVRFHQFLGPNHHPGQHIPALVGDDIEGNMLTETGIGIILADVEIDPGSPGGRSGGVKLQSLGLGQ